jgi:hypothetical protein
VLWFVSRDVDILFYIICTAPFFLGVFARFAGLRIAPGSGRPPVGAPAERRRRGVDARGAAGDGCAGAAFASIY